MQIDEKIRTNPLRKLGYDTEDILSSGEFGVVAARAGVGKTSFMVQLALNAMIREKRVLHISLDDPVKKINLWYREVFQRLCEGFQIRQHHSFWESILPRRFIMTLQVDGFRVTGLEERLNDLSEQNIFTPDLMMVDGLPFEHSSRDVLSDFKQLVREKGLHAWFSVRTHRHEPPMANGLPLQLENLEDLFDSIIQLQPEGSDIHVRSLKGGKTPTSEAMLYINPSSMLMQQ